MFQKKNLTLLGFAPALAKNTPTSSQKLIKHAYNIKRSVFTSFSRGGGGGKTQKPHKKHFFCVRHAEGMRALHAWCAKHRSDSVARSTPTAQQERPNNHNLDSCYLLRKTNSVYHFKHKYLAVKLSKGKKTYCI